MHAALFGLKRAWQSSLRVSRQAFAALGLTAARFDLLYAMEYYERRTGVELLQSELRRELGVSRTTVSRMLASLEALGLVKRERATWVDGRTWSVRLTRRGRARIRLGMRRLVRSGAAELVVDTALGGVRWYDESVTFGAMEWFESFMRRIRRAFGDFARLHYPWHPDD
jgi:DNA-binding MarR family transcriptional regulator